MSCVDFQESDIRDARFDKKSKLSWIKWWVCRIEGTNLKLYNNKIGSKPLIEEFERKYIYAEKIYQNLKNYFNLEGMPGEAGFYLYKEKICEMKKFWKNFISSKQNEDFKNFIGLLKNLLKFILCGYGERPIWILGWWLGIIIFFGTIYLVGEGIKNAEIWFDYYYFSTVTFTTLGFGDLAPIADKLLMKICAMSEALLGAIFMALFVVVLSRKMFR